MTNIMTREMEWKEYDAERIQVLIEYALKYMDQGKDEELFEVANELMSRADSIMKYARQGDRELFELANCMILKAESLMTYVRHTNSRELLEATQNLVAIVSRSVEYTRQTLSMKLQKAHVDAKRIEELIVCAHQVVKDGGI